MLASEGGAITWVAMHRMHHTLSDRPGKDLHTPKDGFWWSHIGWILCKLGCDCREIESTLRAGAGGRSRPPRPEPPARLPEHPRRASRSSPGAAGRFVVWGVFLRMVVDLHATWFVNSATHTWGYRTYDTPEGSTNLWWVGLLAWGEGWHNNHHAFQRSARHGHAWWEFDMTWMAIRGLMALGLAQDVQGLPATADKFRLDRKDHAVLVEEPAA